MFETFFIVGCIGLAFYCGSQLILTMLAIHPTWHHYAMFALCMAGLLVGWGISIFISKAWARWKERKAEPMGTKVRFL